MRPFSSPQSVISVFVAVAGLFSLACAGPPEEPVTASSSQADIGQASYETADSLRELLNQSTIVAIGQIVGTGDVVNMARNPANISEPDPTFFILGQTYQVEVQRYLKGSGSEVIEVLQPEGFINGNRTPITQQAIERSRATYSHIPMDAGNRYLFFLKSTSGFPDGAYFTGVAHPWRFTLPIGGIAQPESPWRGATEVFPPQPSAKLVSQVEQLVLLP